MTDTVFDKDSQSKKTNLLEKHEAALVLARLYSGKLLAVLIFLLDHRNNESGRCDPSYETLAWEANVKGGRTSVIRMLKPVLRDGWLIKRGRYQETNKYEFDWLRLAAAYAEFVGARKQRKRSYTVATSGDGIATRLVAPVPLASDASVTSPSDASVTQSRESETGKLIQESNLAAPMAREGMDSNSKKADSNADISANTITDPDAIVFDGKVFKINARERERLGRTYPHIKDMAAELLAADSASNPGDSYRDFLEHLSSANTRAERAAALARLERERDRFEYLINNKPAEALAELWPIDSDLKEVAIALKRTLKEAPGALPAILEGVKLTRKRWDLEYSRHCAAGGTGNLPPHQLALVGKLANFIRFKWRDTSDVAARVKSLSYGSDWM